MCNKFRFHTLQWFASLISEEVEEENCAIQKPVFGYLYAESLGFTEVHFPTYLHGNCTFNKFRFHALHGLQV